jgi:hypothetical protein
METTSKRNKKRYGWLLFFTAINWLTIAYVILNVDPDNVRDFVFPGSYFPMILLVAGGIFWLLSILFMSALRAMWWTIGISLFLFLRLMQLGTLMNGILILGLLVSWEVYTFRTKASNKE